VCSQVRQISHCERTFCAATDLWASYIRRRPIPHRIFLDSTFDQPRVLITLGRRACPMHAPFQLLSGIGSPRPHKMCLTGSWNVPPRTVKRLYALLILGLLIVWLLLSWTSSGQIKMDWALWLSPLEHLSSTRCFTQLLEAVARSIRRHLTLIFPPCMCNLSLASIRFWPVPTLRYGDNDEECNQVRCKTGRGLLYPDCFLDNRFLFLPPAAAVILVLFNRNHNVSVYHLSLLLATWSNNGFRRISPKNCWSRTNAKNGKLRLLLRTLFCEIDRMRRSSRPPVWSSLYIKPFSRYKVLKRRCLFQLSTLCQYRHHRLCGWTNGLKMFIYIVMESRLTDP
jgi:hypothetical protein